LTDAENPSYDLAVPTDAQIQRLADEAERGYDVDALLARRGKRGRPALGSTPPAQGSCSNSS
jgi:hypothetical protein